MELEIEQRATSPRGSFHVISHMAIRRTSKMASKKQKFNRFAKKNKKPGLSLDEEINFLNESCKAFTQKDIDQWRSFEDYPISRKTKAGLKKAGFVVPTEIQRDGIAAALKGDNVLGKAKTGSGKTLAFLVPVLERLYKSKWSNHDGLGVLIISPTRELALQIYSVFTTAGGDHDFSIAGMTGGKDRKREFQVIDQCNIIVCTPGRLMEHIDKNYAFNCDNLQMLILDEADQLMSSDNALVMNKILNFLPDERHTLLYSATLTNSVEDLARLRLKRFTRVSAHERSEQSTPVNLHQSYAVSKLEDKTNALWAFLDDHPGKKILVFMSTCKQVRYLHAAFRRLRTQTTVFELTSKMHQDKRNATYDAFHRKQNAVLFATDVAARGLDFPGIDWVVQLDCPQDSKTYIHRVGRTARHEDRGQSLLVLLPSEEEEMLKDLAAKKIPISKTTLRKANIVETKLQQLLSRDVTLKECAQRAFVTYFKSVFLMKNKKIFDVTKLNKDEYAKSLGLFQAPRIRFLQAAEKRSKKLTSEAKVISEIDKGEMAKDKMRLTCSDESENELLTVKSGRQTNLPDDLPIKCIQDVPERSAKTKKTTKAGVAKRLLKQKVKPNTRIVFGEDGQVATTFPALQKRVYDGEEEDDDEDFGGIDIDKQKAVMEAEDRIDKEVYRQKIKDDHKQKRLKEKEARRKRKKDESEEDEEDEESEESEEEGEKGEQESEKGDSSDLKRIKGNDSRAWPIKTESRRRETTEKMPLAQQEELALRLLTCKNS